MKKILMVEVVIFDVVKIMPQKKWRKAAFSH
jgi:hypothetical protein